MSAEIHTIDNQPAGLTIGESLQQLQELHEAGKLSAVAFALVYRDGTSGHGWSKLHSRVTMIGSVSLLKANLEAGHLEANN